MRHCEPFLKLLQAVLELGNHLNAGTHRGSAAGFKIDTLLKLADIKAVDRKTSLLQFVIEQLRIQDPAIDEMTKGMEDLKPAATIQLSAVSQMLQELRVGLKNVQVEIEEAQSKQENETWCQIFIEKMTKFYENSMQKFEELQEDEKRALHELEQVTQYYGEDFVRMDPIKMVRVVRDFLLLFEKCLFEIKAKEENEKKEKDRNAPRQTKSEDSSPDKQKISGTTIHVNAVCV